MIPLSCPPERSNWEPPRTVHKRARKRVRKQVWRRSSNEHGETNRFANMFRPSSVWQRICEPGFANAFAGSFVFMASFAGSFVFAASFVGSFAGSRTSPRKRACKRARGNVIANVIANAIANVIANEPAIT